MLKKKNNAGYGGMNNFFFIESFIYAKQKFKRLGIQTATETEILR
jgi:hypothetical protein